MISHSNKFIFISPPKTASTSIASSILNYINTSETISQKDFHSFDFYECDSDFNKKKWNLFTQINNEPRKHASLSSYRSRYLIKYKLFAVVRNPYERIVSLWMWETFVKPELKNVTFLKWLQFFANAWWHRPQFDFLHSPHNKTNPVKIIKFENLKEDIYSFCNEVKIPIVKLLHLNFSKHKNYLQYYNDETYKLVSEKYSKDIKHFGYENT
jgi:hypothetical protein